MISYHFNQDILQRFLRAELSRMENQSIVRHLLARCPHCLEVVREADRAEGLRLTGPVRSAPVLQLVQMR
jgi:hypothetical protein